MKKVLLLVLMFLPFVSPLTMNAADADYRPMMKVGKAWDFYYTNSFCEESYHVSVVGDTIIGGEQCYKTYAYATMTDLQTGEANYQGNYGFYLEKDRKVYSWESGKWSLLYDFNLEKGDVVFVSNTYKHEVLNVDSITVKGETYRRITLKDTYPNIWGYFVDITVYWVEGIGCSAGMMKGSDISGKCMVSCWENGERIFTGWDFGSVPSYYQFLAKENMTWKMAYKLAVDSEQGDVFQYSDLRFQYTEMFNDTISFNRVYSQSRTMDGTEIHSWAPENYSIGETRGRVYQMVEGSTDIFPIMDFTLKVGDELQVYGDVTYKVIAVSDTLMGNVPDCHLRHCIYVKDKNSGEEDCWVEGIGSLKYGISGIMSQADGSIPRLLQCAQNGRNLYWCGNEISEASVEWPADMTSRIVNPRFENNDVTMGWSGTRFNNWNPVGNVEFWNNNYNTFQKIEHLPNGVYAIGAKAFYVAGILSEAFNHFKANDEASHYAKLYAEANGRQTETSICSVFDNNRTEPLGCDGEESVTDEETGKTYYIPYLNLAAAERYMHELDCYDNKVLAMVTDGSLTLGVKKEKKNNGDWNVFDDFTLLYYGTGAEAYQAYLDDVQKSNEEFTVPEGTLYTEFYLDAVKKHRTASTEEEVIESLADIQTAYDNLEKNISLWGGWKQMMKRGLALAAAPCFADTEQAKQLAQICGAEAEEKEAARSLTNEQLEAEINETRALINALYDIEDAPSKMLVQGKSWVYNHYRDSTLYDEQGIPYDEIDVVTKKVFTISGDTIIGGKNYFKLYSQEENETPVYSMALREEGNTVYNVWKDQTEEKRYIEFDPVYFDDVDLGPYNSNIKEEIEYVTVNDRLFIRHTYRENDGDFDIAVEGVGYENNGILGMSHIIIPCDYLRFEACYEDGVCIFTAKDFNKPSTDWDHEYIPFIEDGKVWKVGTIPSSPDSIVQIVDHYYLDGDTIINGKNCKQMMRLRYVNADYAEANSIPIDYPISYEGAWYEENGKVYVFNSANNKFLLKYDFSAVANDWVYLIQNWPPFIIGPRQTGGLEGFKGVYRDVLTYQNVKSTTWLEGVGGIDGPTRNAYSEDADHVPEFLMSCSVGDEVIYLNDDYEDGASIDAAGARKDRFDFVHIVKPRPKAPSKQEEIMVKAPMRKAEEPIYGEYNELQLDINLNPLADAYMVSITNEAGKVVYEKAINAGSIVGLNIDISAYAKGRYTVTVENSLETFTGEFEVQTTGIEEVSYNNKVKARTDIFNLQGQRISSLQKGLNIVNGRKVVIK